MFGEHRSSLFDVRRISYYSGAMPAAEEIVEPAVDALRLPRVLHALSDPVRLDIVRLLAKEQECRCGGLGAPVSKSTLSHHLKTLREAGVTRTRQSGTTRYVSLRRAELDERFPGLLAAVLSAPTGA
jgi:DNA-binding transcriptional ArsR family regulator